MAKVLYVTGFGPFPGIEENPTEEVAQALHETRAGGLRIVAEVLPVSFARAHEQVRKSLRSLSPRCVLHLGLSLSDTVIRLETWAANEMTGKLPDVDGIQPWEEPIDPKEEVTTIEETSLPIPELVDLLRKAGFDCRISRNAGRYVCNHVYYKTLDYLRRNGSSTPALLAHLPLPGFRPFGDLALAPWNIERLTLAAGCLAEALAALRA